MHPELNLSLIDTQWTLDYIDHDRSIVRAIVFDDAQNFYFCQIQRDDEFGKATLIETSGGGVEEGENLEEATRRELKEELGVEVNIVCKIGVVSDYYNLIHRHNIQHYFLCKAVSFGQNHLTEYERNDFNLSMLKLTYDDAFAMYKTCAQSKLGTLIASREIPVLERAGELIAKLRERA